MHINQLHPWDVTPAEARRIQNELRSLVSTQSQTEAVRSVAGVDVGISGDEAVAAVVLLSLPSLTILEVRRARRPVQFPYVPGLLSFREAPVVLDAMEGLSVDPDVILVDGQGLCHPRRFGIASHIGVLAGIPTVGCAKSRLCGDHSEPAGAAGSYSDVFDGGEALGVALRTRTAVKPVYVSIGHRIDLHGAIRIVLDCCRGRRLPEPTRFAHQAAAGPLFVDGRTW